MFDSSVYGLSNPALTEDIGMAMFKRQFPCIVDSMGFPTTDISKIKLNSGQPENDTVEKQNNKKNKRSWLKNLLIGGATAVVGLLAIYKGKSILNAVKTYGSKVYNFIKNKISP